MEREMVEIFARYPEIVCFLYPKYGAKHGYVHCGHSVEIEDTAMMFWDKVKGKNILIQFDDIEEIKESRRK